MPLSRRKICQGSCLFQNSKMEAHQTAAGFFTFDGTTSEAGQVLRGAGFSYVGFIGLNRGYESAHTDGCILRTSPSSSSTIVLAIPFSAGQRKPPLQ